MLHLVEIGVVVPDLEKKAKNVPKFTTEKRQGTRDMNIKQYVTRPSCDIIIIKYLYVIYVI